MILLVIFGFGLTSYHFLTLIVHQLKYNTQVLVCCVYKTKGGYKRVRWRQNHKQTPNWRECQVATEQGLFKALLVSISELR